MKIVIWLMMLLHAHQAGAGHGGTPLVAFPSKAECLAALGKRPGVCMSWEFNGPSREDQEKHFSDPEWGMYINPKAGK